ncbi:MAG: hypothetical protein ABW004_08650 [Aeromicrobium sp.]
MRTFWVGPVLALAMAMTGCSESDVQSADPPPKAPRPTAAASAADPCPEKLPQAHESTHGLGTSRPAVEEPHLPAPQSAWVCVYQPRDTPETPSGGGTIFEWVRARDPVRVDQPALTQIRSRLDSLSPAHQSECRADLGLRYVLVYAHGEDWVGVSADDFGCQDVRLTDDPFNTVAGEARSDVAVAGVLTSSDDLVAALEATVGSPED